MGKAVRKILMIHPVPPPWAGVEQVGRSLTEKGFGPEFELDLIKSNIRDSNAAKGRWDAKGILRTAVVFFRVAFHAVFKRPDIAYLPISQNHSGLARDCAYISVLKLFLIPVVGHLHGSQLAEFLNQGAGPLGGVYRFFLLRLEKLIVLADFIQESLAPVFGKEMLEIIHNGVSDDSFFDKAPRADRGNFHFSFMGHLSRAKGFYDLLQAAEVIMRENPSVRFLFAGERIDTERNVRNAAPGKTSRKEEWNYFEDLSAEFPGRLFLKGMVQGPDKQNFFEESDVFVFPSREEAFPLAPFEAMAAGLPVICAGAGSLGEIFKDGVNGWLVERGSVRGLVTAMQEAISRRETLAKISRENRDLAGKFTAGKMAENVSRVFKKILSNEGK